MLLVDVNGWGALAAAEAWGGAWASWCPYPLPLPSRDAPPFGPGLPPAAWPAGRLRDALLRPLVFGSLERIVGPRVNEVRARVGVPPLSGAADMFAAPPLLLYMTAEPFEYPRSDWPENVRLVGPCDWDPPADAAGVARRGRSADRAGDDVVGVPGRRPARALRARGAGRRAGPRRRHAAVDRPAGFDAPANARVLPFVPHGPILDRAACAVTHGGMGATQKALARGVPVCAVPFGRDQFEVARRVEVAGAGDAAARRRLSPERLRAAVRRRSAASMARAESPRVIAPLVVPWLRPTLSRS